MDIKELKRALAETPMRIEINTDKEEIKTDFAQYHGQLVRELKETLAKQGEPHSYPIIGVGENTHICRCGKEGTYTVPSSMFEVLVDCCGSCIGFTFEPRAGRSISRSKKCSRCGAEYTSTWFPPHGFSLVCTCGKTNSFHFSREIKAVLEVIDRAKPLHTYKRAPSFLWHFTGHEKCEPDNCKDMLLKSRCSLGELTMECTAVAGLSRSYSSDKIWAAHRKCRFDIDAPESTCEVSGQPKLLGYRGKWNWQWYHTDMPEYLLQTEVLLGSQGKILLDVD